MIAAPSRAELTDGVVTIHRKTCVKQNLLDFALIDDAEKTPQILEGRGERTFYLIRNDLRFRGSQLSL
mgnify:CR=1 FL=1